MMKLDIVFIADGRFEGGASTALALEIREAARSGLRAGLLAVKGPLLGHPFPMHPDLRSLIDGGGIERLDPEVKVEADLVLLHHPTIVSNRFTSRLHITTQRLVVVLHHPAFDRTGKIQYDVERIVANCRAAFDNDVILAPVSQVVRHSLPRTLPKGSTVIEQDWTNLVHMADWPPRPQRAPSTPVVIGRHARPDKQKWPDDVADAFCAYPADGSAYRIRILGGGPFLEELYGVLPPNWEVLPFSTIGVAEFLVGLDFYVYFHSAAWSEAFGRTILEALAVGLVVILPAHFRELFGDAAVYAKPREVKRTIARFVDETRLYVAQSEKARKFVADYHRSELFALRLKDLFGISAERQGSKGNVVIMPALPVRSVLFTSTNGIGIGHLAQQMAIAQRLTPDLKPIFATMSYAMKVATDAGYHTHFLPHHHGIDADPHDWNLVLAEELFDLFTHLRPRVFAYDASAVFHGVVSALATHPNIYSVWVRRPMWRESHRGFLEHARSFDAVIEPGELASEFDHGPTRAMKEWAYVVPPVLLLGPDERLDRAAARRFLDIPDDATVVALQLGSGSNFDLRPVRKAVVEALLARPDTIIVDLRSPIRADFTPDPPRDPRHRIVELFPSFRYSRAFDAAVAAPGYNTFHENILGSIPSLFVPNEADNMDLQLSRARWAELSGMALLLRREFDLSRAGDLVAQLLDPSERAAMSARCSRVEWRNGADDIARFIEDHARIVRTDWDVSKES
ncbi:glycosyltransferase [Mesorhizobium australicum]|uniref:glycosyltransferase n=1 Tax=Mesorhizobium australicum TaxID=536018 RepID=UPI003337E033